MKLFKNFIASELKYVPIALIYYYNIKADVAVEYV